MHLPITVVFLGSSLLVSLRAGATSSDKGVVNNKVESSSLHDGLNHFSLDMYKHIAAKLDNNTNIFFSPIGIASALMLVYAGANGETAKELTRTLRLFHGSQDAAATLQSFHTIMPIFQPSCEKSYSLDLANRLYLEETFTAKDSFELIVQSTLNSSIETIDFKDRPEDARKEINQWVEQQTSGQIKNLVTKENVNENTILTLINAIYFKNKWADVLDSAMTKSRNFTNLDGSTSQVPTMEKDNSLLKYYSNLAGTRNDLPSFHMISKPYEGGELSLLVLLPGKSDGLAALEKALTAEKLGGVIHGASERTKIHLKMPKFKLEECYDLEEELKALGVVKICEGGDLSGIADDALKVSSVVHKAFVDVNEESTEATAATFVGVIEYSASIEPEPLEFHADHPFLFAVRHDASGLLLLLGRIAKL
ncbi:hypothetical protein RvY_06809 [Ramazzottius varieornatus]|uniref:Serpin domain-containing protein n=1 Tax=Ramazzottius varieornatus TaxID=947166 RepID=A0A1D1UZT2_RAMVA|nr:hypothetical protein RvY_06809 [Ramazzottius varieornatus]